MSAHWLLTAPLLAVQLCFFFQAEDGIRDYKVTGVQTCALPISREPALSSAQSRFTVLFGMGRSGTNLLWSSGITCCHAAHGATQRIHRVCKSALYFDCALLGITTLMINVIKVIGSSLTSN